MKSSKSLKITISTFSLTLRHDVDVPVELFEYRTSQRSGTLAMHAESRPEFFLCRFYCTSPLVYLISMVSAGKHPKAGKKTTGKVPGGEVRRCRLSSCVYRVLEIAEEAQANRALWNIHL